MNRLIGSLAVGMVALLAPLGQAAIQISFSVNGGAVTNCALNPISTGPAVCALVASGPVTILQVSATSNSPGGPINAQEFGSTLQIMSTAAATLDLFIGAQDFTFPVTPPPINFASSISTTSTTGTGTSGLVSCVDTTNGLGPSFSAFCPAGPSLTNVTLPFGPGPDSTANTVTTTIASLSAPFSLEQHISLVLSAGSNLNVITNTVLTPVPEPMSIALLGGVLLLISLQLRRKRNRALKV